MSRHWWTVIWVWLIPAGRIQAVPVVNLPHHIARIPYHDIVFSTPIHGGHDRRWWWWCSIACLNVGNRGVGQCHRTTSFRLIEPHGSGRISVAIKMELFYFIL